MFSTFQTSNLFVFLSCKMNSMCNLKHQQTRNFVTSFYRPVQNCTELYRKGHYGTILYKRPQAPTDITSLLMKQAMLTSMMPTIECEPAMSNVVSIHPIFHPHTQSSRFTITSNQGEFQVGKSMSNHKSLKICRGQNPIGSFEMHAGRIQPYLRS